MLPCNQFELWFPRVHNRQLLGSKKLRHSFHRTPQYIDHPRQSTHQSNRILYLNSIIIHMGSVNGGHYVTFFRKDKKWYLYDDINPNIIYIGNYFKMLHTNPNPCTNGVLYFYS